MTASFARISAISLFVEDLAAAKAFYREVFATEPVHEDEASAAFRFENVVINLLRVQDANEIVAPAAVAPSGAGSRFQLSVWVPDVEAVCVELRKRGVTMLNGPITRAWGMRTANFVDPAGHSWEVGQQI